MERLILDTSILIDAEGTAASLATLIADDDDLAIAAITAAELLVGVELADGRRRTRRAAFVEEALDALTIEDYTLSTARAHSTLLNHVRQEGRPRSAHDLIIAATASATDRILVTTDRQGFAELPGVAVRSAT